MDAGDATWLLAPGADVLEACARGALDAAVVGKDLLLELAPQVHELLDLRVCRGRLVYAVAGAGRRDVLGRGRPRVATRYPRRDARATSPPRGRQVELVAFGAAALAPALGIADGVVELRSRLVLARRAALPAGSSCARRSPPAAPASSRGAPPARCGGARLAELLRTPARVAGASAEPSGAADSQNARACGRTRAVARPDSPRQ